MRYDQIRAVRCIRRTHHCFRIKILAETDGCRLEKPAAVTKGRLTMGTKIVVVWLRIASPETGLALPQSVRAMKFNQMIGERSGQRMQAIDILGDHSQNFSGSFQFHDRIMDRIWSGRTKSRPSFQLVIPMFDASRFRAHEVLIIDRSTFGPYAAGPTEIGNTTRG